MGIRFRCQACDKKLHVKSFLAGKRGVCPKCGAKIRIPAQSDPAFATETDSAEQAEPPDGATASRSAAGREPEREIPSATAASKATRATAPVASSARVSEGSAGGPSARIRSDHRGARRRVVCASALRWTIRPRRWCGHAALAGRRPRQCRCAGVAGRLARLEDGGSRLSVAGSFAAASAGVGVRLACRCAPNGQIRLARGPAGGRAARARARVPNGAVAMWPSLWRWP